MAIDAPDILSSTYGPFLSSYYQTIGLGLDVPSLRLPPNRLFHLALWYGQFTTLTCDDRSYLFIFVRLGMGLLI